MAIYLMIYSKNLQHYNKMTLQRLFLSQQRNIGHLTGADPGFPVGKKLHEIETNLGQYLIRTVSPLYLDDRIHVSKFFTRK